MSIIPLTGAFFLGLYQIVTRKVSANDKNETSLFYSGVTGIFLMGFISFFFWKHISTDFMILFVGVGVFYSLGLYFQIIACK